MVGRVGTCVLAVTLLLFQNEAMLVGAITCFSSAENATCCGDACFAAVDKTSILYRGCIRGEYWKEKPVSCFGGTYKYCVCKSDYCNTNERGAYATPSNEIQSTCDNTIDENGAVGATCDTCEATTVNSHTIYGCQGITTFTDFLGFLNNSCLTYTSYANYGTITRCSCQGSDFCSRMIQDQQDLVSTAVTCHVGDYGNETCTGDFCYIHRSMNGNNRIRGCVTFNQTLQASPIEIGYFTAAQREFYICNTTFCNYNWANATASVPEWLRKQPVTCGGGGVEPTSEPTAEPTWAPPGTPAPISTNNISAIVENELAMTIYTARTAWNNVTTTFHYMMEKYCNLINQELQKMRGGSPIMNVAP